MSPIDRARQRSDALHVLGLKSANNPSAIRKAYRKLAFELHPDRETGDEAKFMEVTAAYDLLKAEAKRRPQILSADDIGDTETESRPSEEPEAQKTEPADSVVQPSRAPLRVRRGERRQEERRGEDRVHIDRRQNDRREDDDWTLVGRARPEEDAGPAPNMQTEETEPEGNAPRSRLSEKFQRLSDGETERCRNALRETRVDGMTDHVPQAISRTGRRISVHIETPMAPGANRVAISLRDLEGKRAETHIVVFSSGRGGAGVIDLPQATLAEMFPGARELKLHFALGHRMDDAA